MNVRHPFLGGLLAALALLLLEIVPAMVVMAAFVDTGDAFDNKNDFSLRTGVGVGARWRSPIGGVRIDIAHGLDDPDSSFQLYLSLGANL